MLGWLDPSSMDVGWWMGALLGACVSFAVLGIPFAVREHREKRTDHEAALTKARARAVDALDAHGAESDEYRQAIAAVVAERQRRWWW